VLELPKSPLAVRPLTARPLFDALHIHGMPRRDVDRLFEALRVRIVERGSSGEGTRGNAQEYGHVLVTEDVAAISKLLFELAEASR
jgi:hypothetical protein